jgi:hypothetical protein
MTRRDAQLGLSAMGRRAGLDDDRLGRVVSDNEGRASAAGECTDQHGSSRDSHSRPSDGKRREI